MPRRRPKESDLALELHHRVKPCGWLKSVMSRIQASLILKRTEHGLNEIVVALRPEIIPSPG